MKSDRSLHSRVLTSAPELTTGRLLLRGPQDSDLDALTEMVTQSDRMAHVGGKGTSTEAWRAFISGIGHWQMRDFGFFTITDRNSGETFGRCGLLRHVGWPETEMAYHLFDGAEGRGIAYEACVAVRRWAGENLGLGPLASFIAPANARSRALAKRLGAVEEGLHVIDGDEALVHRHLAHDAPLARAQWLEVSQ
ncbi:GCN5 family acetyltransferase [Loktanella sp. 3ANDIMAR09]|uniref:GNAT family N-acetyltransferase n=1 Tax=Loktanella sp. 3ANDIMAR09 TaxID=1225657 RepID=UPI0006FCCBE6|nr:GNAT family N-acetyltransferase [Loktanella sp. 3ANDIMAR09]KQI68335.1 GCN5 family acetyltransferase [Loktanella sp. 3ANDIMAR09]